MCVQYRGGAQYYGGVSTVGDILSTVGGYLEYRGGDILSTVGGYLEYRGGYLEYRGGIS